MKTKVILAFQGCGKSYVTENVKNLKCKDMDFKYYRNRKNWEREYIRKLKDNIGSYDYIFCNISEDIMRRLKEAGISFYVVSPLWKDDAERDSRAFQKLKAIMFGHYVLRKEQTPENVGWINRMKKHYDEWTAEKFFTDYVPADRLIQLTCAKDTIYDVLKNNFYEDI